MEIMIVNNDRYLINTSKHIYEGWTVGDFIEYIEPVFNIKMKTIRHPFMSELALKKWVASEQPYYKKHVPEVYEYFKNKINF